MMQEEQIIQVTEGQLKKKFDYQQRIDTTTLSRNAIRLTWKMDNRPTVENLRSHR